MDGVGNVRLPRPSFTYTNTFCSAPPSPVMMNSVVVPLPSRTHTGSAFILMASGLGASPSSLIAPVMLPAVFGSTALAAGAPDGAAELLGAASCLLPPPQATAVTAMASTGAIRPFIERGDIEFLS